jgi:hypothetical protein
MISLPWSTSAFNTKDTICSGGSFKSQQEYQLNSGYFNYASLDNLYSDNVYAGGNLFYGIAFGTRKKILTHTSVKFSILNRNPRSLSISPGIVSDSRFVKINHLHFELDNIYRFQVWKGKFDNLKLYISGNWFTSGDFVINDHIQVPELFLSSIAPGAYAEYGYKSSLFYIQLSSSLISYTCRSSYSLSVVQDFEKFDNVAFTKDNSRIQFPNSLFTFFANAGWKVNIFNRFGMQMEYHFRYLYDSKPRILKSVTGIYSIGLVYTITKK